MNRLTLRPNRIAREMDSLFGDFFNFPSIRTEGNADFMPRVNIKDGNDEVELTFEVPGMDKKDIKVSVKDSVLTVSGSRSFESEEKKDNYVRTEIRSGSFCRSFTLPDTVNSDKVKADYKDGMLKVTMPKLEEVKPKEIEVKID